MGLHRVGVLVGTKGRGSNMMALIRAGNEGCMPAVVDRVISTRDDSPALQAAKEQGVRTLVVPPGESYGEKLTDALMGCDLVCLAGYMRLLPEEVLQAFPGRVLNIHPALLPKFGGKGMYGHYVHEAVLAAQERESGCTVHYVNEKYDDGASVVQLKCPVLPDDTPDTLAARVLELEHQAYMEAVRRVLNAQGN